MSVIRGIVDEYPYLAMDTEFPGVVARPVGNFKNSGEYHYQMLRQVPRNAGTGGLASVCRVAAECSAKAGCVPRGGSRLHSVWASSRTGVLMQAASRMTPASVNWDSAGAMWTC